MSLKNNYITYQGYECLSACLVNYLRFMNYRISGSDIFLSDLVAALSLKRMKKRIDE